MEAQATRESDTFVPVVRAGGREAGLSPDRKDTEAERVVNATWEPGGGASVSAQKNLIQLTFLCCTQIKKEFIIVYLIFFIMKSEDRQWSCNCDSFTDMWSAQTEIIHDFSCFKQTHNSNHLTVAEQETSGK